MTYIFACVIGFLIGVAVMNIPVKYEDPTMIPLSKYFLEHKEICTKICGSEYSDTTKTH